jgi:hypothetical protein
MKKIKDFEAELLLKEQRVEYWEKYGKIPLEVKICKKRKKK